MGYIMKMETTKLDLRFADPDDAEELLSFVNNCHEIEFVGPLAFRDRSHPFVTLEELDNNCSGSSGFRWIVLETPAPEEVIVAAVRICIKSGVGSIDILCGSGSPDVELMLISQLLAKVENIVRGHFDPNSSQVSKPTLEIHVPQWREERIDWLSACGFVDNGGDLDTSSRLTKPTMILHFSKDLSVPTNYSLRPPANPVKTTMDLDLDLDFEGFDLSNVISSESIPETICSAASSKAPSSNEEEPALEDLVGDLFRALRKEYANKS